MPYGSDTPEPGLDHRRQPERDEIARARVLILAHGKNATAYQILNPGIRRWFGGQGADDRNDPSTEAVVGFVETGRFRVVAGSPICADEHLPEIVSRFERDARKAGQRVCYFAAEDRLAAVLAERGPFDRLLLGAQPVWNPASWNSIFATKASLRAQLNRARNKGVTVEPWSTERATGDPGLERCLDEWLSSRGLPPLHFLVEPGTLERLFDRRVYVAVSGSAGEGGNGAGASKDGVPATPIGFLIASPIPARNGWLIEQIIRGERAPNGTSELMLDLAMRDLAAAGADFVTLGLSPLSARSGLEQGSQKIWTRWLLGWMRAHGRRFYDFDGLDAFKAKFLPERWEPIWAITGEPKITIRTLYAIAGAFSGTSPIAFVGRGLLRALRQEVVWASQRSGRSTKRG